MVLNVPSETEAKTSQWLVSAMKAPFRNKRNGVVEYTYGGQPSFRPRVDSILNYVGFDESITKAILMSYCVGTAVGRSPEPICQAPADYISTPQLPALP